MFQIAPVDKLSVALTVILSVIFLQEVLRIKTAIRVMLILAGVFVIIK